MKRYCLSTILIITILFSTFLYPINANAASSQSATYSRNQGEPQAPINSTNEYHTHRFHIYNKTGAPLVFSVEGPMNKTFSLDIGKNDELRLIEGHYRYHYEACKQVFTGTFTIKATNLYRLILPSCQADPSKTSAKIITATIHNDTGAQLTLVLGGKTNYTFILPAGINKIQINAGRYQVRAFACLKDRMIYKIKADKPFELYVRCDEDKPLLVQ